MLAAPRGGLRVVLDALAFGAEPAGVGRYVTTLLRGFAEIASPPEIAAVARFAGRGALGALVPSVLGPGPRASRAPFRALWEQVTLPVLARLASFDLLHGLMGVVPLLALTPRVVTIHDVTFLTHPELHQPAKVRYFRALLPLSARAARLVLTDSQASAEAIVRTLRIAPERVRVVPLAVDATFTTPQPGEVERIRRSLRLPRAYVLYAGALEPRKNLPVLIQAIVRLRALGYPHQLVLAGKDGWGLGPIETALAAAGTAVRRLGYVPDADLKALLLGAEAFAYVPLCEGFGLPVAEALACGVPVVTSDRSSLPEVAGGAAVLVDPTDPGAVASGLARVLDSPDLRADLASRGLRRAAELSPRRLAEGTLAAYQAALG